MLSAAMLLIRSATVRSAVVSYRISHPTHPLGFIEDWLQLPTGALGAERGADVHESSCDAG
jgi:hypothetical protein